MAPVVSKQSAAQPATEKYLVLAELNKTSAKTGASWIVAAWQPNIDKYEYAWKGKQRQGENLIVILVSPKDPKQYCQGQFKRNAKNENKYEHMKKVLEHGKHFVMSNVHLLEDARTSYISCPLKCVVDLSSTKMDICAETPSSVVQPALATACHTEVVPVLL